MSGVGYRQHIYQRRCPPVAQGAHKRQIIQRNCHKMSRHKYLRHKNQVLQNFKVTERHVTK
jgi:hypothetical protein